MGKKFISRNLRIDKNDKTLLCGILNVTPDSFSDGGKYTNIDLALNHAREMVRDGASILDIGGESTRPGGVLISSEEEISRVCPVIEAIKRDEELKNIPVSVDTWKADVAQAAIKSGAEIINDITGLLGDSKMAEVVKKYNASVIIMFNPVIFRPNNEESEKFPKFGYIDNFSKIEQETNNNMNIVDAMKAFFEQSLNIAKSKGIDKNNIMLDPGIGFGMTKKENLQLLKNLSVVEDMGYCSFVGVSRKRLIVNLLAADGFSLNKANEESIARMDYASSFLTAIASYEGINVLRVHDIKNHKYASIIGDAIRMADEQQDELFEVYKN